MPVALSLARTSLASGPASQDPGVRETGGTPRPSAPRRPPRTRLRVFGIPFLKPRFLVGAILLVLIVLAVALGPFVVPFDPNAQDLTLRILPPSLAHPLGTDHLGRDILARVLAGGRISLALAIVATIASAVIGIAAGLVAGYRGRRIETAIMGVVDAQLAFPFILLAIALVATIGPSVPTVLLVMALSAWVGFTRPVHAATLALKDRDFVTAAVGLGLPAFTIIRRHLAPHVLPIGIVVGTVQLAQLVLFESALSFLGLGVPPSVPTWGAMLSESRTYIQVAPWTSIFPGLAIVVCVFAISIVGDWLRTLTNPRG